MENTQTIWTLYVIMFSLNCFNAEEGATAAKKTFDYKCCWINPTYIFENALTSKFVSKHMLEKRFCFCFHRKWEDVDSF